MSLRWSDRARRQQRLWLEYLEADDPRVAHRALVDSEARAAYIAKRPHGNRASRWPGFREALLRPWRKLIVYEVVGEDVTIIAFFDQRQDLSRVDPRDA